MLAEYSTLLENLGKELEIELQPDSFNTCQIHFEEDQIDIQLELEQNQTNLLLGSTIATLPPGRYKQDLLEQALKANYLDDPKGAILAYSPEKSLLVAFLKFPLDDLEAKAISTALPTFREKVKRWKESIESNSLPPLTQTSTTTTSGGGMFGLS